MPRAFSTVPTRAAACTGVNRAWILRSARASSADLEGAAVPAVRVPAAASSPRLQRLALRPRLHLRCHAWSARLARSRGSARGRGGQCPGITPRGRPSAQAARRGSVIGWRRRGWGNGVTPLPDSPPTHSSAPECWPEVKPWGSVRVRGGGGGCVTGTERVPRATRSDRPPSLAPCSLGGASPGSALEPGLDWPRLQLVV